MRSKGNKKRRKDEKIGERESGKRMRRKGGKGREKEREYRE